MEYSATIFAQELTRIELEHLCFLGPEELVHAFAKDMKSSSQNLPTDEVETEAQVIIYKVKFFKICHMHIFGFRKFNRYPKLSMGSNPKMIKLPIKTI